MTGDEAALHALSAEPRRARAGDTIVVRFRTRNVGTAPSPPGTVAFAVGTGLEPLGALDVPVGAVAPGEDVLASVEARVAPPAAERVEIGVSAALHVGDAVLRTNACTIVVHGRPVFDGPCSGTDVEAIDAHRVRVRAVVVNEGDGPAREVRIVVPVPVGCVREDGGGEEIVDIPRLEIGERAEVSFEAWIAAVVGVVRADDGVVQLGDGRGFALPVRGGVVPRAMMLPPNVVVTPGRRRGGVEIELRNDGWADAHDVRVTVELPHGTRWIADSFTAGGAPVAVRSASASALRSSGARALASVERDGDARVVVVSAVPARGSVRVACGITHDAACSDGTVSVRLGEHTVEAPFVPLRVRDVRVRIADAVQSVVPGEVFRVAARVENAGDVAERLSFGISGVPFAEQAFTSRMIPAGCGADIALECAVPNDLSERASFAGAFVATADDGESVRAAFELRVRSRFAREPEDVSAGDARERGMPRIRAQFGVPETAVAGAPFGVRLTIDAADDVDTLAICAGASDGAAYVPGTARLDDQVLLDRADEPGLSPLEGDGLVLRAIPAGTRLSLLWSVRPEAVAEPTPVVVSVRLETDGETRLFESSPVTVRARDAFAARRVGTAYHVASCATAPASWPAENIAPGIPLREGNDDPRPFDVPLGEFSRSDSALTIAPFMVIDGHAAPGSAAAARPDATIAEDDYRSLPVSVSAHRETRVRLHPERLAEIGRLFANARAEALVDHLFVVRFFFPDRIGPGSQADVALDAARNAVRDLFDRLFVKRRIPGFDVCADDLEDLDLRRALIALFERLAPYRADTPDALGVLAEAPYGSPSTLRVLVGLLRAECDDDPAVGAAIAAYASGIDDVLARYVGLPLEIFDDALAHRNESVLDDARRELLRALRTHLAPAALAC